MSGALTRLVTCGIGGAATALFVYGPAPLNTPALVFIALLAGIFLEWRDTKQHGPNTSAGGLH